MLITIAKNELSRQMLSPYSEELYIMLSNEIIYYVKTLKEKASDDYKDKITKISNNVVNILKNILDSNRLENIKDNTVVPSKEYSEEDINLIKAYTDLRTSSYSLFEGVGYSIIRGVDISDNDIRLIVIALNSLKIFKIDEILMGDNKKEMYSFMNIVNNYLRSKELNFDMLSNIESLNNEDYNKLIEILKDSYIKSYSYHK